MDKSAKYCIVLGVIIAIAAISLLIISTIYQNNEPNNFAKELQSYGFAITENDNLTSIINFKNNEGYYVAVVDMNKTSFLQFLTDNKEVYNGTEASVIRCRNSFYAIDCKYARIYCYTP